MTGTSAKRPVVTRRPRLACPKAMQRATRLTLRWTWRRSTHEATSSTAWRSLATHPQPGRLGADQHLGGPGVRAVKIHFLSCQRRPLSLRTSRRPAQRPQSSKPSLPAPPPLPTPAAPGCPSPHGCSRHRDSATPKSSRSTFCTIIGNARSERRLLACSACWWAPSGCDTNTRATPCVGHCCQLLLGDTVAVRQDARHQHHHHPHHEGGYGACAAALAACSTAMAAGAPRCRHAGLRLQPRLGPQRSSSTHGGTIRHGAGPAGTGLCRW